ARSRRAHAALSRSRSSLPPRSLAGERALEPRPSSPRLPGPLPERGDGAYVAAPALGDAFRELAAVHRARAPVRPHPHPAGRVVAPVRPQPGAEVEGEP